MTDYPPTAVGVDIESVSRFDIDVNQFQQFFSHIFTSEEITYCQHTAAPAEHFAARYAAKEAVVKALYGLGYTASFHYSQIEIVNTPTGAPIVQVHEHGYDNIRIAVSLSHAAGIAVAFCFASRKSI